MSTLVRTLRIFLCLAKRMLDRILIGPRHIRPEQSSSFIPPYISAIFAHILYLPSLHTYYTAAISTKPFILFHEVVSWRWLSMASNPPPKRRRGGCRQQLAAESRESGEPRASSIGLGRTGDRSVKSAMAAFLLLQWSLGLMSPQLLRILADKSHEDQLTINASSKRRSKSTIDFEYMRELEVLAGIGDHGAYANNCNRDLQKLVPPSHLSLPDPVQIPLKDPCEAGYRLMNQTFLWPHQLFSQLFHHYKEGWAK